MAHSNASKAQIVEIVNQLGNGRINAKLAQAVIEGRVEIIDKPREQTGSPYRGDLPSDRGATYRAPVNYAPKPMNELREEFDWVSDLYDGRPWERHSSCASIDETSGEREFALVEVPQSFLGKRIDKSLDALAGHFDRLGYRFAIEVEAIAFAKVHPDLQRKHYILALGSSALGVDDDRYVACLRERDDGRGLSHYWVDHDLDGCGRLLLVRK